MICLCDPPVLRKPKKDLNLKFKVQGVTENFMKLKFSGTPKLCWADQVKRKLVKIGEFFWFLLPAAIAVRSSSGPSCCWGGMFLYAP